MGTCAAIGVASTLGSDIFLTDRASRLRKCPIELFLTIHSGRGLVGLESCRRDKHTRFVKTIFKGGIQRAPRLSPREHIIFHKCQLVVSRTESEKLSDCPIGVTQWSPTDKLLSKRRRLCHTHPVEALAEVFFMVQTTSSCCIDLSELTFNIPIRVMGRAAAIARRAKAVEQCIDGAG